jgi:hypothetical protein
MSRSIWVRKFIPMIELEAKRVFQEEDEYHAVTRKEFSFTVKDADVQPVKGNELLTLEEGYRVKSVFKVYTPTEVIAGKEGSINLPDKIKYRDVWYSVFKVEPWLDGLDAHYCVYMVSENGR